MTDQTAATLRPLAPGDALAWARCIATERARTYADAVGPGFLEQQLRHAWESVPEILEQLADGSGRYVAAWHDGRIVGGASSEPNPMGWERGFVRDVAPATRALATLYLEPAWHGSGLADAMLEAVLDDEATVLWLILGNERARRFYERRGFAPWGDRQTAGESWNHVPMQRMLRGAGTGGRG